MKKISEHISFKEATKSITAIKYGIDNIPNDKQLQNMQFVAITIFESMRKELGEKPIGISSFFRSKKLNTIIGGSDTSDHCDGAAIDIDSQIYNINISNKEIFDWIKKNSNFKQLIYEFGNNEEPDWIHVSKVLDKNENKGEVLRSIKDNGQTKYLYY